MWVEERVGEGVVVVVVVGARFLVNFGIQKGFRMTVRVPVPIPTPDMPRGKEADRQCGAQQKDGEDGRQDQKGNLAFGVACESGMAWPSFLLVFETGGLDRSRAECRVRANRI